MPIDRRTFLGQMAAGLVVSASPEAFAAQQGRIERVGMQLYTARAEMEKDFEGTLARVAGIGYKEVEFAGYFNRTPAQVRTVLERHGLTAPSTHIDFATISTRLPETIEASRTIGHQFIVLPWLDETLRKDPDIWKKVADTLNKAGEAAKGAGIQMAYHNHHFEFLPVGGRMPYDMLLEMCDPALVKMELDLCWVTAAGQDPLAYFEKHPGRFPMVHVKGLRKRPVAGAATPIEQVMPDLTDVGTDGDLIDWARIFARSSQAGLKHYFVEHDQPKGAFDSLAKSFKYVQSLRF